MADAQALEVGVSVHGNRESSPEILMSLLNRQEIEAAFRRLGELASLEHETMKVVIVGGAAMVLGYDARPATHDVDGVFMEPPLRSVTRQWIGQVASEQSWPEDWFNDAAKGFLVGLSFGRRLFSAPGIEVWQPLPEQLLAMKLGAWRDDVDVADATCLLRELISAGSRDEVWSRVEPFVTPGRELKARYAFNNLWEELANEQPR